MTSLRVHDTETRGRRAPVLGSADHAVRTATRLAERFTEGAAKRDRGRRLPYPEVAELAASGLLGITVPKAYGGPELPPSVAAEVFRILGAADPNIAQIPHSHFVYTNLLRVAGSERQRRDLYGQVLAGRLVANAQSERGGATITDIRTTLAVDERGHLVLDGTKYYCTGTLFADVIPVLCRLSDDRRESGLEDGDYVVFLPALVDGISIADDWDAVGQRTTASGTVTLDGVKVSDAWVVQRARAFRSPNGYGAFAQLLHAAIDTGIARGALDAAAEFVRTKSRPWFEAEVASATEDPLVVQRFGELSVEVTKAEAVLEHAARAVDLVFARPGDQNAAQASLAVAAAKVVAEQSSLAVSSGLFEVSGTRSAGGADALDRHWRNARTHTLHDPIRWKLQHLGRFALTGQEPPAHGVI
jgi:SfnB family sulfur acquisition oxidoreductase